MSRFWEADRQSGGGDAATHRPARGALLTLALASLVPAATAQAQAPSPQSVNEAQSCAPIEPTIDAYRELRSLSLALRGHPPSPAEYAALRGEERVPEAMLDAWLTSPAFAQRTVRWHRELLWNNVTGESLVNVNVGLGRSNNIYFRTGTPSQRLRGRNVPCLNQPATFDAAGEPVRIPQSDGTQREGYVELTDVYWAPGETIRVCALDARAREVTESGTPCGQRTTVVDDACGCGPQLRWCGTGETRLAVLNAMNEQVDRFVSAMILEGRSYLDLFQTQEAAFNGPLVHYWRYQTQFPATLFNEPAPVSVDRLPALRYDQRDTWVTIQQGDHHAGVLTSPGFLLRFQTDRARATQFYTKFLCQPFQPLPNGIQTNQATELASPDLQKRDGCDTCHALLEPAAAHWGRWPERSAGYLDPQTYPAFSEDCKRCAETGRLCSDACNRFYLRDRTEPGMEPYFGRLTAYLWRDEQHHHYVERGPALLAQQGVADGRLASCIAERSAESLFGRELTSHERDTLLPALALRFARAQYSYPELVKAIVTSPAYRSVR